LVRSSDVRLESYDNIWYLRANLRGENEEWYRIFGGAEDCKLSPKIKFDEDATYSNIGGTLVKD
jgi:hypothetical protein